MFEALVEYGNLPAGTSFFHQVQQWLFNQQVELVNRLNHAIKWGLQHQISAKEN